MRRAFLTTAVCSLFFVGTAVSAQEVQYVEPNLLTNADFSEIGINGDPVGWLRGGWGENTRSHEFEDGVLKVTISSPNYVNDYVSGDVKWYFEDIAIAGDKDFFVSYEAATNVEGGQVVARYTLPDGSYYYQSVGTIASDISRPGPVWLRSSHEFTVPDR